MNKVVLMGRLTRNPEVRTTETTTVAKYALAVDRKFHRDGENTADFINCVTFGKSAEFAEKYLKKGTKVVVVGRIRTGSYTNKDGQKVYTTEVAVDEHEFCESRNSTGTSAPAPSAPADSAAPEYMNAPDGIDDDIPFN